MLQGKLAELDPTDEVPEDPIRCADRDDYNFSAFILSRSCTCRERYNSLFGCRDCPVFRPNNIIVCRSSVFELSLMVIDPLTVKW